MPAVEVPDASSVMPCGVARLRRHELLLQRVGSRPFEHACASADIWAPQRDSVTSRYRRPPAREGKRILSTSETSCTSIDAPDRDELVGAVLGPGIRVPDFHGPMFSFAALEEWSAVADRDDDELVGLRIFAAAARLRPTPLPGLVGVFQ